MIGQTQTFNLCQLCRRAVKRGTTLHHLIPRSCHRNKWFKKTFGHDQLVATIDLCRDCHTAVHRLVPREKELGRHYNTLEKLRQHPEISKFVHWVRRQR